MANTFCSGATGIYFSFLGREDNYFMIKFVNSQKLMEILVIDINSHTYFNFLQNPTHHYWKVNPSKPVEVHHTALLRHHMFIQYGDR